MDISLEKEIFIMKMLNISLQLPVWVYRETDFMISTILCYVFYFNCTKVSLYYKSFSHNVVIKCFFPNFLVFAINFCNS